MDEAKARASELPDDLLSMVRQSTSGASEPERKQHELYRNDAAEVDAQAEFTQDRRRAQKEFRTQDNGVRTLTSPTAVSTAVSAIFATGRPQGRPVRCHFADLPRP